MNGSANITQDYYYCKYYKPDSDVVRTVKIITISLLTGLGVLGNIFAIVVAAKYTVRKNLHHLIINMAVSDILFIFLRSLYYFQFQVRIFDYNFRGTWGEILCKTMPFLYTGIIIVSAVTLLVISIERFKITRQTVQIIQPYRIKKRVAVLACLWVIPLLIFIPFNYQQMG